MIVRVCDCEAVCVGEVLFESVDWLVGYVSCFAFVYVCIWM